MFVILSGIINFVMLEQLENEPTAISVIVVGMLNCPDKLEHELNAFPPILVKFGNVMLFVPPDVFMLVIPLHPLNALFPIVFNVLGIVTVLSPPHPRNV